MKVLTKEQQRAVSGGYHMMRFTTYQGECFLGHNGNFYSYVGYFPDLYPQAPYYYDTYDI